MVVTMHATECIMFITFHSGHTILSLQLGNGHQKTADGFENTARADVFQNKAYIPLGNYKVSQLQNQDSRSRDLRGGEMFHFSFIASFSK